MKLIKSLIFKLLPEKTQRELILHKTGVELVEKAHFTSSITRPFYIIPGSKLWRQRLATPYGHEPMIVRFYEEHLTGQDRVMDVGAQAGFFPALISNLKPECEIVTIEASWMNAYYLRLNEQIHDPGKKWTIIEKFISNKEDALHTTIDRLVANKKSSPTILQMDIDGGEVDAIAGASNLLDEGKTEFIIEVHPKDLRARGQSEKELIKMFADKGYQIFYLMQFRGETSYWSDQVEVSSDDEEFYIYCCKGVPRFKPQSES